MIKGCANVSEKASQKSAAERQFLRAIMVVLACAIALAMWQKELSNNNLLRVLPYLGLIIATFFVASGVLKGMGKMGGQG